MLMRKASVLDYEPAVFGADASRPMTPGLEQELNDQLREIEEEDRGLREALDDTPSFIPPIFCDPLTGNLMLEPVVAPDGFTYERSNILKILAKVFHLFLASLSRFLFLLWMHFSSFSVAVLLC